MDQPGGQSSISAGIEWATRIGSISLLVAAPMLLGGWVDGRYGSKPVGLIVGLAFGMLAGVVSLVQIARDASGKRRSP